MMCRQCSGQSVHVVVASFDYSVYGCMDCGLVWLVRRRPFKTQPPKSR
jgi:uncharacterized Zn finger protein